MGYFDGLTEGYFKTDAAGQRIYYPFGFFGRGRILSTEDEEKRIKTIVKRATIAALFGCIIIARSSIPFEEQLAAFLAVAALQYTACYYPVRKHPSTNERMKLTESYRRSARRTGRVTLWVLFGLGVLMTSVSAFAAFVSREGISEKLTLLGGVAFFGVGTLVIGWMIRQAGRRD